MIFRFKEASLTYDPQRGYRHPRSGQWVAEPRQCLAGWIEPDRGKRGQWLSLLKAIDDFWRRNELNQVLALGQGQEIVFEGQESFDPLK